MTGPAHSKIPTRMIQTMNWSTSYVDQWLLIIFIVFLITALKVSLPGTPARSVPPSRPQSPTPRAAGRPAPGPLHLVASTLRKPTKDPLKIFPTDLSQKIFNRLSIKELAKCARVSRKWSKSQTLNYGEHVLDQRVSITQPCVLFLSQYGSSITGRRTSTMKASRQASGLKENRNKIG